MFKDRDDFFRFRVAIASQFPFITTQEQDAFLSAVASTSHTRSVTLKAGESVYRAQIDHDWLPDDDGVEEQAYPVPASESRMRPDPKFVADGRANPHGVAVFYAADNPKTAVTETRPQHCDRLTVTTFTFKRDVRLVDCSVESPQAFPQWLDHVLGVNPTKNPLPREAEIIRNMVWHDIDTCFSRPVSRSDSPRQYRATQCLAGLFRREGFDGIIYRSKSTCGIGRNYAIFDQSVVTLTKSLVVEVQIQEPTLKVLCDDSDPLGPRGSYGDI